MLGLAFDPQYAANRRFCVSYTDTSGDSVVARYLGDPANPDLALGTVDRIILSVAQPDTNHNGGMIAFGPDNFLYLGFGDGGGAGKEANFGWNIMEGSHCYPPGSTCTTAGLTFPLIVTSL